MPLTTPIGHLLPARGRLALAAETAVQSIYQGATYMNYQLRQFLLYQIPVPEALPPKDQAEHRTRVADELISQHSDLIASMRAAGKNAEQIAIALVGLLHVAQGGV